MSFCYYYHRSPLLQKPTSSSGQQASFSHWFLLMENIHTCTASRRDTRQQIVCASFCYDTIKTKNLQNIRYIFSRKKFQSITFPIKDLYRATSTSHLGKMEREILVQIAKTTTMINIGRAILLLLLLLEFSQINSRPTDKLFEIPFTVR